MRVALTCVGRAVCRTELWLGSVVQLADAETEKEDALDDLKNEIDRLQYQVCVSICPLPAPLDLPQRASALLLGPQHHLRSMPAAFPRRIIARSFSFPRISHLLDNRCAVLSAVI